MSRPVDALLDFLKAEEARGVQHVHLDDEVKAALRELHRQGRQRGKPQVSGPMAGGRGDEVPSVRRQLTAAGGTAAERIASLKMQAAEWEPALALKSLRRTMVFSTGDPEADLMLVGEAPGHHEEREGEAYAGPAGEKLNDILKAMGLGREAVYISNIVKFRPSMPDQTTNNRKPTAEEMAVWLPFIREEVKIVRPKCIIALGATAAEGLLGLTGPAAAMRGAWHRFEGVAVRVTLHPALLLPKSAGMRDKRQVWEDMLAVMEKLGLPISEKQRGFFLERK